MGFVRGLYSGVKYDIFAIESQGVVDAQAVEDLDDLINEYTENYQQDSIVSIFMIPKTFSGTSVGTDIAKLTAYHSRPNTIDGYTPRNKKLFTYPYCFLSVDTLNDAKEYRFEWSKDDGMIHFVVYCGMTPTPEIVVAPVGYNGTPLGNIASPTKENINSTESITCTGFPQCPYIIDSYRAWLAQHKVDYVLNSAKAGAVTASSLMAGNYIGAVTGVTMMLSNENERALAEIKGNKVRGTIGTETEVAGRFKAIYYKTMTVTAQYARMIDDFFDRFGYTTGRIKIPNRDARPHWTYTKTKDISLRGTVPTDDMRKIKEIYDNGITFWKNGSEVGNYSLNNAPVSS